VIAASPTGSIDAFASNTTDLILDINGYFADPNGTLVPSQPHAVHLGWDPSLSPNIVGYNLYRGSVSGGPYTLVNTAPLPQTFYADSNVMSGETYYYVATALDSSNVESAFSNETSARVPNP
jgi:fibronectin type 3 domain-containing protein